MFQLSVSDVAKTSSPAEVGLQGTQSTASTSPSREEDGVHNGGESAKWIAIGVVLGVLVAAVVAILYVRFAKGGKDDDSDDSDSYTSPQRGKAPHGTPPMPHSTKVPAHAKVKRHTAQYGDTGVC